MDRERGFFLCALCLAFVTFAGPVATSLAGTTSIQSSPEVDLSEVLGILYPNGETITRVQDFVDGYPSYEGLALELLQGLGHLTGRTDQTWTDGIVVVEVTAKFAGYGHSFGWERDGVETVLFSV
ncbi:MAG: hypothetical protein KJ749_15780, partial [Planctomycetes bacterium]|nr:hypothetical protein [Planctomycetota bacterium]